MMWPAISPAGRRMAWSRLIERGSALVVCRHLSAARSFRRRSPCCARRTDFQAVFALLMIPCYAYIVHVRDAWPPRGRSANPGCAETGTVASAASPPGQLSATIGIPTTGAGDSCAAPRSSARRRGATTHDQRCRQARPRCRFEDGFARVSNRTRPMQALALARKCSARVPSWTTGPDISATACAARSRMRSGSFTDQPEPLLHHQRPRRRAVGVPRKRVRLARFIPAIRVRLALARRTSSTWSASSRPGRSGARAADLRAHGTDPPTAANDVEVRAASISTAEDPRDGYPCVYVDDRDAAYDHHRASDPAPVTSAMAFTWGGGSRRSKPGTFQGLRKCD